MSRLLRRVALAIGSSSAALLIVCGGAAPVASQSLACDDGIKTAFKPDANTSVVAVRLVKKGEALIAQDSAAPITAAAEMDTPAQAGAGSLTPPLRPRPSGAAGSRRPLRGLAHRRPPRALEGDGGSRTLDAGWDAAG